MWENLCNRAALYNFELCTLGMSGLCFLAVFWKLYQQRLENVPLFALVCLLKKKKKTDLETVSERYCPLAKELVRRNCQVLNVVIVFHVVCLHRIKTCG